MNHNFFNLSKRKKRDVLSALLTGDSSEGMISNKELNALHKLLGPTPKKPSANRKQPEKTKKTAARKKKKETQKKTTYYLSKDVFENLDRAKKEIQSIVPENLRSKVSKTQIVSQALTIILKEFEDKGENSRLVRNIKKK
jgi:hypothetical protein